MNKKYYEIAKQIYEEYNENIIRCAFCTVYKEDPEIVLLIKHPEYKEDDLDDMNLQEIINILDASITKEKWIKNFPNIYVSVSNNFLHYDGSTYYFAWECILSGNLNIEEIYNYLVNTDWKKVFSNNSDCHLVSDENVMPYCWENDLLNSYISIFPTDKETSPIIENNTYLLD